MDRRILYLQFTDPAAYPPLEHSATILAKRGWDVLLLGVGTLAKDGLELVSMPGVQVKRIRYYEGGWRQKLQYLLFFWWTFWWTWRWQPHWIYASDPLSCPIAWWLRKIMRVRILYHEHDSPMPDEARTRFMMHIFSYRSDLAREAELCVLPEQVRLQYLLQTTGRTKPAYCVWNCPTLAELDKLSPETPVQGGELIIYYHGSITPDRLPTQLIVAASRFKGAVRVRVAGYETVGSIGYMNKLTAFAAANRVGSIIEHLGTIPTRSNLLQIGSSASVGIALMPKRFGDFNMKHMVGASNKSFDYMACGLPLLVTDLPDWIETFVEPGYARACNPEDADSIESALRWYLEHPVERNHISRLCRQQIRQRWNYDMMFSGVITVLEST